MSTKHHRQFLEKGAMVDTRMLRDVFIAKSRKKVMGMGYFIKMRIVFIYSNMSWCLSTVLDYRYVLSGQWIEELTSSILDYFRAMWTGFWSPLFWKIHIFLIPLTLQEVSNPCEFPLTRWVSMTWHFPVSLPTSSHSFSFFLYDFSLCIFPLNITPHIYFLSLQGFKLLLSDCVYFFHYTINSSQATF